MCPEHNAWHRKARDPDGQETDARRSLSPGSTDGQTPENQRRALEAVASQRGWTVVATYDDNGVSGAKGRDQRIWMRC